MEKLHRHANGSAVTLSDETAVSLKRVTGRRESGVKYFEFFSSPTAEKTTIEWTGDVAVIPTLIAKTLLTNGYAENISELQLATWNEAVDGVTPEAPSEPEQTPPPVAQVADVPPPPAIPPVVEEPPPVVPPVVETPPVTPPATTDELPMPPLPPLADPKKDALQRAEAEAAKATKAKKASGD